MPQTLEIEFDYPLERSPLNVRMKARAVQHNKGFYSIDEFCIKGRTELIGLPVLEISLAEGKWVHRDSGKETVLSEAIGAAIEGVLALR
jgi:hypothetical protein